MGLFNFFKKKVEVEEEVQPEVKTEETSIKLDELERITYGSFYAWESDIDYNVTAVWDFKEKDFKASPYRDKVIGMIETDHMYCIDPDTGKQFFIFVPSKDVEYKSIRAFNIKDILIELDMQKSAIKKERNKMFRDARVQYLESIDSKVEVDLCNTSMSNE